MKILVTGLTSWHTGRPGRGIARLNPPDWIVQALRAAGHDVTWTGLRLGDPIPEHHVVWFVASSPQALGARTWGLGALSALGRTNSPYVLQLDDWKVTKPFNDARVVLRDPGKQLHRVMEGKPYYNESDADITRYEPCILAGIERMLAQRAPQPTYAVLAYRWGDVELLRRNLPPGAGRIIGLDVSPLRLRRHRRPDVAAEGAPLAARRAGRAQDVAAQDPCHRPVAALRPGTGHSRWPGPDRRGGRLRRLQDLLGRPVPALPARR